MKLEKFKEEKKKQKSIILFTIACVILITGVFLYKTFASFQVVENEDMIEGEVQDIGDLEFAFYKEDENGQDKISKTAPGKEEGYSLDTSSSYCKDMATGEKISRINWDNERWGPYLSNITTTKTKCYLHFKKIYKEDTLNGAIPDLMNGRLVPVVIITNGAPSDVKYVGAVGGKVEKADIIDTSSPWYSYKDKKWANAVILKDGATDTYQPGDEIPESEIESYFVWIPRYKYKLKNDEETYNTYTTVNSGGTNLTNVSSFYSTIQGNKGETEVFDIQFETKDKGVYKESTKDKYLTHPAFVAFDSNGFWVGKFETGYNQNNSNDNVTPDVTKWNTTGAQRNENNSSKVIIKPNVYSWRGIQVANAFYTAYNYQRELESHMMKNTEWGAVAYLTQSKYGRCKDNKCTEVRINNSGSYITGMSATLEPTCGYTGSNETCNWYGGPTALNVLASGNIKGYYLTASQESSTTGNYSGIYDMSGGSWEYVMGVMQGTENDTKAPASGRNQNSNSGFKGPYSYCTANGGTEDCKDNTSNTEGKEWPSSKYYDLYDYKTKETEYQRGILGDATKELGPFYSISYQKTNGTGPVRYVSSYNADGANFVHSNNPWFSRGAASSDGTDAGVGAFSSVHGNAGDNISFRVILTP